MSNPTLDHRLELHKQPLENLHKIWNDLRILEGELEHKIIHTESHFFTPDGVVNNLDRDEMIRVFERIRECRRYIKSAIDEVVYPKQK